ncbi:MAG: hypothetical protein ACPG6P_06450 [Akkermansiaceae bacterium]
MAKNTDPNSTPREITSHLEEEDLWDLDDAWADDEPGETEADTEGSQSELPLELDSPAEAESEEESTTETAEDSLEEPEPEVETDEDLEEEEPTAPETEPENHPDADDEPAPANSADEVESTATENPAPASLGFSLKPVEKITLALLAALLIGAGVFGYIHISKLASDDSLESLDLPVKGKHAEISEFSTFWSNPGKAAGITLGAQVVPGAKITLSESSSGSGILRVYFRNEKDEIVGDPIPLTFTSGKFSNGKSTIEVSASDGFHQEADYHAYSVEQNTVWRVQVLESSSTGSNRSDFSEIINTAVHPVRR